MNSIKAHDTDHVMEQAIGTDLWLLSQKRGHLYLPLPQDGHFILFQHCDVSLSHAKVDKVRIICDSKGFSLVSESKACRAIAHDLDSAQNGYAQLHTFLCQLLAADVDSLLSIEDHICAFEDGLFTSKKAMKTAPQIIINLRRSVLRMKRYYQQLHTIAIQLSCEEAAPLPLREKFSTLSHHIAQLLDTAENLQELTIQARETYQGQIGIQQNNLMKLFTVITTIFMPLTVIVGWYGMNFDTMPELHWQYGYLYVILLSIAICGLFAFIFKWKKWFD